jgi:hypothetical protein
MTNDVTRALMDMHVSSSCCMCHECECACVFSCLLVDHDISTQSRLKVSAVTGVPTSPTAGYVFILIIITPTHQMLLNKLSCFWLRSGFESTVTDPYLPVPSSLHDPAVHHPLPPAVALLCLTLLPSGASAPRQLPPTAPRAHVATPHPTPAARKPPVPH